VPHVELGTVLVTGGASGLGAAVAQAVKKAHGTPVVLDRHKPAASIDHEIADLADSEAGRRAVRRIAGRHGGLDGVVCCAGTDACGPLSEVPIEDWERVVKVNLIGTATVVRAALPYLEESGGKIVTVASTLGLRGAGDATAYCASKFGVVGFSRALAAETAGRVGVTCLIPGGMQTAFFDECDERYRPPVDAKLNRPEDVAQTVLFALSQPPGCEIREVLVAPSLETTWP
jgi:NAD(P)-dependent dehydrogenase (short-subunit alcohol dehydrogenase family)